MPPGVPIPSGKARFYNLSTGGTDYVEVPFNPTEYGIDRGATYAELAVPGLDTPILQYVRGTGDTLNVELFLDASNQRSNVEELLGKLRTFVTINSELHAPPVVRFVWGAEAFEGVVTALREKFSLLDTNGHIVRARVTITLKRYKAIEVQLRERNNHSPDRTRVRVVRAGDSLASLATEAYGDPRRWRVIAEANDIDHPRFLTVGASLRIPAI